MVVVAFAWAGVFVLAVAFALLVPLSFALPGAVAPFSAAMVTNPLVAFLVRVALLVPFAALVLLMAVMAGQLKRGRAWVEEC